MSSWLPLAIVDAARQALGRALLPNGRSLRITHSLPSAATAIHCEVGSDDVDTRRTSVYGSSPVLPGSESCGAAGRCQTENEPM